MRLYLTFVEQKIVMAHFFLNKTLIKKQESAKRGQPIDPAEAPESVKSELAKINKRHENKVYCREVAKQY